MLLHAVLAFALFETLLLAGVLLWWADRVAGARPLAAFLAGIALWLTGNEWANWWGRDAVTEATALHLLGAAPLTSAFFFHFCVAFCRKRVPRGLVAAAYALGVAGTAVVELVTPGRLVADPYVGWIAVGNTVGIAASGVWVVLALGGIGVLLSTLRRARAPVFAQVAAVTASCLWGVVCLTGYGMAVMHWPVYPFPLLGFPLYPVILVYGILRYGVFVANAWARRALVWTLLLGTGAAVVALTPLLPIESRWIGGLAVAASSIALNGPVRRLAERLVYPGGDVTAGDLAAWRAALAEAEDTEGLSSRAAALLGARVGMRVEVVVGEAAQARGDIPHLVCTPGPAGWTTALHGWQAAPPGPTHVAELFGSVVAEAAGRVAQARALAARERERQLEARLAELGAIAATVAHDIRNPLNIISMAMAFAPGETRAEVAEQVARISHLASDLLDYAKPWTLQRAPTDLSELVRRMAVRWPALAVGPGLAAPLVLDVDARRVQQALQNLVDNAQRAAARLSIDADTDAATGAVRLHVRDNGLGVPEEVRARLFEPFVSRGAGGTGLGLAIVARVMAAHGGTAALEASPPAPWRTGFTLTFPPSPESP